MRQALLQLRVSLFCLAHYAAAATAIGLGRKTRIRRACGSPYTAYIERRHRVAVGIEGLLRRVMLVQRGNIGRCVGVAAVALAPQPLRPSRLTYSTVVLVIGGAIKEHTHPQHAFCVA